MKPLAAIQRDQYDYTLTSSYSSTSSEALRGFPTSSALSLAISLKERRRIRTKLHFRRIWDTHFSSSVTLALCASCSLAIEGELGISAGEGVEGALNFSCGVFS